MVRAFGAIHALDVLGLVERKDVAHDQGTDDGALAIHQRHGLALADRLGLLLRHREGDRNRPGVGLVVVKQDLLIEDPIEGGTIHRAGEGAETAVADAIEAGQVGVAYRHLGEHGGEPAELGNFVSRHHAVHRLAQAAMGRNQIGHSENSEKKERLAAVRTLVVLAAAKQSARRARGQDNRRHQARPG